MQAFGHVPLVSVLTVFHIVSKNMLTKDFMSGTKARRDISSPMLFLSYQSNNDLTETQNLKPTKSVTPNLILSTGSSSGDASNLHVISIMILLP